MRKWCLVFVLLASTFFSFKSYSQVGGVTLSACTQTTLSSPLLGGTWSVSNTAVASINPTTGVVAGLTAGTTFATYSIASLVVSVTAITVTPLAAITGNKYICGTGSTVLNNVIAGGIWTSSNVLRAVVVSPGVVVGVSAGTATISYTLGAGCLSTTVVSVNTAMPAISGTKAVCAGAGTTLGNEATGGTWSSGNTGVATINSTTGVVSAIAAGTANITYRVSGGLSTCSATAVVTVNAIPAAIAGQSGVCMGATTTLTTSTTGGVWSTSNNSVASITSSGIVNAVAPGTALITYTSSAGCITTRQVTVNELPEISGPGEVCEGLTIVLNCSLNDGAWGAGSVSATIDDDGVITGITAGTALVSYRSVNGCESSKVVTVNATPQVSCVGHICVGHTTTLSATPAGGSWHCGGAGTAHIDSNAGIAGGLSGGVEYITYELPTGCTAAAALTVNVNPAAIAMPGTMCTGTTVTMSSATAGGTWTCSSGTLSCIDSNSGTYLPTASGTPTVVYRGPNGCTTNKTLSVSLAPSITGRNQVCKDLTTTLSCIVTGGSWYSVNPSIASIDASNGIVAGIVSGSTSISYNISEGCRVGRIVQVNTTTYPLQTSPVYNPVLHDACIGNTIQMQPTVGAGGTWTSSNTAAASISNTAPTGVMTAIAEGVTTISYMGPNGCIATYDFTVHTMPVITSSAPTICKYATTTLSGSPAAGQWFSQNQSVAIAGINTGVIQGTQPGTATITYRKYGYNGCSASVVATVTLCTAGRESGNEMSQLQSEERAYSIYPNPGNGIFIINQLAATDEISDVTVYNYLGQLVYREKVAFVAGRYPLDLSKVVPGLYLAVVGDQSIGRNVIPFVVQ